MQFALSEILWHCRMSRRRYILVVFASTRGTYKEQLRFRNNHRQFSVMEPPGTSDVAGSARDFVIQRAPQYHEAFAVESTFDSQRGVFVARQPYK